MSSTAERPSTVTSLGVVAWKPGNAAMAAARSWVVGPTGGSSPRSKHGLATTLVMIMNPTTEPSSLPQTACSSGPGEQLNQPAGTVTVTGTGKSSVSRYVPA